jgi:hypothetical protein
MTPTFRTPTTSAANGASGTQPHSTPGPRRPDDQSGRRRADVTAVDLGYTGRRSRSSHSADDFDRGSAADGYDSGDPHAEQYDWRDRESTDGGW